MPNIHRAPPKSIVLAVISAAISLLCVLASAVIIITSNNDNVKTWKVQPTVLLAVLSSIYNVCLALTLTTAVTICWWRAALHGTKAAPLHYIWERGMGFGFFPASMFAGFDVNKVAAVTLIIAIAKFSNNPLLQRATMIQSQDASSVETMKLVTVQKLPDGWMGIQSDGDWSSFRTPGRALSARQRWWRNDTVTTSNEPGYYCDGTCEGFVQGTGIQFNCSTTTKTLDLSTTATGMLVFGINSAMANESNGVPYLRINSSYVDSMDGKCKATLITEVCVIEAATVKYPLIAQNNTIALNTGKLLDMQVVSVYNSPGDSLATSKGVGIGPLKGLNRFINTIFFSNATIRYSQATKSIFYDGPGPYQDLFYNYSTIDEVSRDSNCPAELKWSSPTKYLLTATIQYLFYAALDAGNGARSVETFAVNRLPEELIFRSDYSFLAGALVVMLVSNIGVFFLLWGWWELDRPVSLSPLETAKAFGAPLMQTASQNDVEGIIAVFGNQNVKYDGDRIYPCGPSSTTKSTKPESPASESSNSPV
jgi:hypothetical protein